jgi:AmiR/NasT family two-component response regulator
VDARKRPRVMLGDLGPIALMGMRRLLSEDGIEVVGGQPVASMTLEVELLRPDVVVLDLDRADSQQLSDSVRRVCPQTKVVLWARTENVMEIMDPGASRPRWVISGVPEDLLAELSTVHVTHAHE